MPCPTPLWFSAGAATVPSPIFASSPYAARSPAASIPSWLASRMGGRRSAANAPTDASKSARPRTRASRRIIPPQDGAYTGAVTFPCPGCGSPVGHRPTRWALRCPACGALLRSEAVEASGENPAYHVSVAGRPETRRRGEGAWGEKERRPLRAWVVLSSPLTLSPRLRLFLPPPILLNAREPTSL